MNIQLATPDRKPPQSRHSSRSLRVMPRSCVTATPAEPNGHKLERFVFDALAATDRVLVMETPRSLEYSPVKNADGSESPATARRDLVSRYRACIATANASGKL